MCVLCCIIFFPILWPNIHFIYPIFLISVDAICHVMHVQRNKIKILLLRRGKIFIFNSEGKLRIVLHEDTDLLVSN